MEWQDIRAALSRMKPPFPHAAAAEARARWDELAFVAEIERVADGGSTMLDEEDGGWDGLFSFATYLAAEKRDARAYLALTRACHCSSERAEELFGDDAGGKLGQILASVCDGDLAPLKALAEDRSAGLWCRFAAMHALTVRVIEGDSGRDEALAYIADLCEQEADFLRRTAPNDDGDLDEFLTWAADASRDLGPAPMLEKIRGWLDEGLIDPSVTGIKEFERGAAMPVADCIAEAAADKNNRYIGDALDEVSSWYCYEVPTPDQGAGDHGSSWPEKPAHSAGTVVRDTPKVGRNDPCPCGSGKKFKKCCGNESHVAVADESKDGGVGKAVEWLTSRHAKAVKTAVAAMLNDDLDASEQASLQKLGDDDWQGVQINAMEWLLSEGSIAVKGVQRNVAGLLLGPGGPAFTAAQRSWIEQLSRRPLRLYDITEVMPGVGMRLCDSLDTEAAPLMVQERSGSEYARVGNLIGVRIMEVGSDHEISGAAYPFSRLMNASLLAQLREAESAAHGDDLPGLLSAIIRRNWIAQYARPLPLPTVIDASSGDPMLLITDHYRVADWDALAAALGAESDVAGNRAAGWARRLECADGLARHSVAINPGKSADRIELFYRTQNYADQGRVWFDKLAGASVAFAGRVLSDPKGIMSNASAGAAPSTSAASGLPPEALAEIVEKVLRRTYANWSDEPIPALGGKTPRQAITTPAGRERVKGLLRSYEAGETEQAARQGRRVISYDFLWRSLGLDRCAE